MVPFNKIAGNGFPIAQFEGANGDKLLKVELFKITSPAVMSNVDSLEGHPTWYKRVPVVTAQGKEVEIYDMFSRTFEDNSQQFLVEKNIYAWN